MDKEQCIADLIQIIDDAIKSGDWIVDGACDPDSIIERAKEILRENGWTQNSVDDSWMISY